MRSRSTRSSITSVTGYRNDRRACWCQIRFASGEGVLVSIAARPHSTIQIRRMTIGGLLPREVVWELDARKAGGADAMAKQLIIMFPRESEAFTHPLDALRDLLLSCGSIDQALEALRARAAVRWPPC